MSIILKITLTIFTLIFANGTLGIIMLCLDSYFDYKALRYYAFPSAVLLVLATIYIPIMFIWHLY